VCVAGQFVERLSGGSVVRSVRRLSDVAWTKCCRLARIATRIQYAPHYLHTMSPSDHLFSSFYKAVSLNDAVTVVGCQAIISGPNEDSM